MTKPEKLSCANLKEIHAQSRKSGLTKHSRNCDCLFFCSLLTCRALAELLERGVERQTSERRLQRELCAYVGHVFEGVCRQWLYIILLGAHCRFRSTERRAQGNRRVFAFAFHQTAGVDYRRQPLSGARSTPPAPQLCQSSEGTVHPSTLYYV